MGERRIPEHLEAEIRRRAAAGEGPRAIARWLEAEHGIRVAHTSIGRLLAKQADKAKPAAPQPELNRASPPPAPRKVKRRKPSHDAISYCGARRRQGGVCLQPAGWGTDHPGTGRCKLHGGCVPGGPVGNKKAVTHGARESIILDALDDDERDAWNRVDTEGLALLEEELRQITVRERRMQQRILTWRRQLNVRQEPGEPLTEGQPMPLVRGELYLRELTEGAGPMGPVRIARYLSPQEKIDETERELTRLQARKKDIVRVREDILRRRGGREEHPGMGQLLDAIRAGREAAEGEG